MLKFLFVPLAFALFSFPLFSQSLDSAAYVQSILEHRETYKQGFLDDERSPLQAEDLSLLRFFEPSPAFRVDCTFERTPDEKPFDLPTYSGITKTFVKYGVLYFELAGQKTQLSVYQNLSMRNMPQYARYLFLPFRDLTNDESTYGGGRYIDLTIEDVETAGPVVDFNKK